MPDLHRVKGVKLQSRTIKLLDRYQSSWLYDATEILQSLSQLSIRQILSSIGTPSRIKGIVLIR